MTRSDMTEGRLHLQARALAATSTVPRAAATLPAANLGSSGRQPAAGTIGASADGGIGRSVQVRTAGREPNKLVQDDRAERPDADAGQLEIAQADRVVGCPDDQHDRRDEQVGAPGEIDA